MAFGLNCHKPVKNKKLFTDSAINSATTKATLQNTEPRHRKKKLYLTFDDGPNKGTRNVLHIAQDEQIPISFFLVGQHVAGSAYQQQLWDSLQTSPNIALCNHSYTHAQNRYIRYYENPEEVVADFMRTKDSLHLTNNIARTPGRNIWRTDSLYYTDMAKSCAAADSLQKAGFILMGWDVEWKYDNKTMSVTSSANQLMAEIDSSFSHNKTRSIDNLVLLAHDQVYTQSDDSMQLRQFLQGLKKRNDYELALVTTYPGADKPATGIVKK